SPFIGTVNGNGATSVAGAYATLSDLRLEFGTANIKAWSDTEGTGTENDQRIQRAFDNADAEIIREFIDIGGYATPLVPIGNDVFTVRHWACVLAGCWLYFLRGTQDDNAEGDRYARLRETVRQDMKRAKGYGGRLNAVRRWPTAT